MLELSAEARRLTSVFLSYRNDIDIYTEDELKDKEFYKVLFKRLIRNDIIINDVTPLGSKSTVIERCANEPENGRKKIFIVDGDIKLIHGKDIPDLKNLFVLDAYCIENFLLDKETIIEYIYLNCAIKSKEAISQELDYENWLNEYCEAFITLFLHFALADFFDIRFTLYNANKYHQKAQNEYLFSKDLVTQDIASIKAEILRYKTESEYTLKLSELSSQWKDCIDDLFTIVSGKDYLIPLLLIKTQCFKKSKSNPSLEEIKMALVHISKLSRLEKLKNAIESL